MVGGWGESGGVGVSGFGVFVHVLRFCIMAGGVGVPSIGVFFKRVFVIRVFL